MTSLVEVLTGYLEAGLEGRSWKEREPLLDEVAGLLSPQCRLALASLRGDADDLDDTVVQ